MDDYRDVEKVKRKEFIHLLKLAEQKLGQGHDSEVDLADLILKSLSTPYHLASSLFKDY